MVKTVVVLSVRKKLADILLFSAVAVFPMAANPGQAEDNLHQRILTIDTHIDVPVTLGSEDADPGRPGPMQVDLPGMRAGGLDAGFFIVYVAQGAVSDQGYASAYQEAQAKFEGIERMLNLYPDEIVLARTPAELKLAVNEGKLVAAIGIENAYPLGPNFEHLQEFYNRGARYISLTHFGHNHFADSSVPKGPQDDLEEPFNQGISKLGYQLIDQMNRMGIMLDVSHTSALTTIQAARYSKTPVIASHSGARALFDHPRNMSDKEILAVANGGGVIQLVAFDTYMRALTEEEKADRLAIREEMGLSASDWYKQATQAQISEVRERYSQLNEKYPRASVSTLVDHIDYVVNLVGIDHAGISSDFGGGGGVLGWDRIAETEVVTNELVKRGYSEEDITKIWGGNLLRVWMQVEKYSFSQN